MNIGERITYFRKLKGYSVNKLANLAGISQSYLRDIELNNKNITINILRMICEVLEIGLKEFFDDDYFNKIAGDELMQRISRLNADQRAKLLDFLDVMLIKSR